MTISKKHLLGLLTVSGLLLAYKSDKIGSASAFDFASTARFADTIGKY